MMRALEMLHFLGGVDGECDLTEVGEKMAEFPVDPHLGRVLIAAAARGCLEEMLIIVAMLSVPTPFMRPRAAQKRADKAHQAFASGLGDHVTLLAAFLAYRGAGKRSDFCWEHYLQERGLRQAESIHRQLQGIARSMKTGALDRKKGLNDALRRSILEGFFMQCACIDVTGKQYLTV